MSRVARKMLLATGILFLYFVAAVSYEANPWAMACLLSSVAVLGLGVFVALKGPTSPLSRTFLAFSLSLASFLLLVYLLHMATVWGIQNVSGAVWLLRNGNLLAPALLMYVVYHFVGGENRLLRALARLSLLSVLPFVLLNLVGLYVTEYKLAGSCYVPANAQGLYLACAVITSLWLVAFWLITLIGTFLPSLRHRRPQFVLLLIGGSMALTVSIAGFIPAFRSTGFPAVFSIGHVGFPLMLGIAVARFGMFDIKLMVRRTLPYAIGTAAIGVLYALYLGAIEAMGRGVGSVPSDARWVVLLVVVGLGFQPLLKSLQDGLDRLFFRTEAELEQFLAQAGPRYRDAGSAMVVVRMLELDAKRALQLESVAVLLGGERVSSVVSKSWANGPGGTVGLALPIPEEKRGTITADDSCTLDLGKRATELSHALRRAGATIAVPFGGGGTTCLLVGRSKLSDLPVPPRDAMFLQALVAQAEMAATGLRARKDAHAATRLTETLSEVMANPVAIVDSKGRITTGNPSFERAFGPAGQLTVAELGLRDLLAAKTSSKPAEIETSKGTFLVSARLLDEPEGERKTVIVMTDVTDLRRLQEAHRRRSVLAEIGAVVSGINHELMNILSPVGFYLRKAKDACDGEDGAAALSVVTQRIESLDRLCKDLRAYYRSPALSLRNVHLGDLVGNTLADLAQTQGVGWVPPRLSGLNVSVQADPQKLKQVLLNVVKNAWEAMCGVSKKEWSIEALSSDKNTVIRIADSGTGIPPSLMKRLFEPFFTTKGDHGTGLGLAVAKRIAEAHGAEIAVDSSPDKGTTVTLRWPTGR